MSIDVQTATVAHLQDLAKDGGRIRFRNGILRVQPQRSFNLLNRALESVVGLTTTKRAGVMDIVRLICKKNGVNFDEVLKGSDLSDREIRKLETHHGDLKAEHLDKALARFIQIGDHAFTLGPTLGSGSFGEVIAAHGPEGQSLALKKMILPDRHFPGAKKQGVKILNEQRREATVHQFAMRVPEGNLSYVVRTHDLVTGPDGTVYQPMELAVATGNASIKKAQDEEVINENSIPPLTQATLKRGGQDPVAMLTVRDWVEGLRQLNRRGLAHRDIKPENFLLTADGYWNVSDFGTAGANNSNFQAHSDAKSLNAFLTGNASPYAKSPEWLSSELQSSDSAFEVGHKDDVFSLGVGVFRILSGGRLPFNETKERSSKGLRSFEYGENVCKYAETGMSFCDWYEDNTGLEIPAQWRPFLNGALHGDKGQRMSADQLLQLDIFKNPDLDDPALRQRMLDAAQRQAT